MDQLKSPVPGHACEDKSQPCEIHEAINRMGQMYRSGIYDNDVMLGVVLGYWDERYWDLGVRWGAHGLDGYVVYAVARNALEFHDEMAAYPTTIKAFEYLLQDHADRGLPTEFENGKRWFHGGETAWNTWSEDFMAFALGFAAADAWFASPWYAGEYFDDYRLQVEEAVDLAFSISHKRPQTLRYETDFDSSVAGGELQVMVRNHGEYSPVYAMAIIARVWDVNTIYRAAQLPDVYSCGKVPQNLEALYRWLTLKIEPNPTGGGYVFRADGCERNDGMLSYCDDRQGDPDKTPGHQREPGHYPLDEIMPQLCISDHLEFFGPSCDFIGPAGIEQRSFNYHFNCTFQ